VPAPSNAKPQKPAIITAALILTLSTLACTCGLTDLNLPSISVTTRSDAAFADQMLEELTATADTFTFDVDAVTWTDRGDGSGALSYRLSSETMPGQDVVLERWVTVEPGEESITGQLELVFMNVGSESTDVVFQEEIPKSVLPTINASMIQGVPANAITILDADPRFEIRLVDFAAGLRKTIGVQFDPMLVYVGMRALTTPEGAPPDPAVVEYAAVRGIEIATAALAMTARDYDFLRESRDCAAIPEEDRDNRALCLVDLVGRFPDKFTAGDCDEIQALVPKVESVAPVCKAYAENNSDRCNALAGRQRDMCLLQVRLSNLNRCRALPGNSQERIDCVEANDRRLAETCATITDETVRESCARVLAERGVSPEEADSGDLAEEPDSGESGEEPGGDNPPPGDTPPDDAPDSLADPGAYCSIVDDGSVYPTETWFSQNTIEATCYAIGQATPAGLELEDAKLSEYSYDDGVNHHVRCFFRSPDVYEYWVDYMLSCWQTRPLAHDTWCHNQDGMENLDGYWQRYCHGGAPAGRPADVVPTCFEDEIFLDTGRTGIEQLHLVEYYRLLGNCSLVIWSSDELPAFDGGVETQHAASLRAMGDVVADYLAGMPGR